MGRAVRFRAWAAAVLVLAGGGLSASPTGGIIGFAKDPSGALMPGVKITLTSIATNVRFTTMTDSSGAYQFPQLPPATYSLIAEASGFKKNSIADVLVEG